MAESVLVTGRKVVRYLHEVGLNRHHAQMTRGPKAGQASHRRKAITARDKAFKILDTIPGGLGTVNTIQEELAKRAQARTPAARKRRELLAKLQLELKVANGQLPPEALKRRKKSMGSGRGI